MLFHLKAPHYGFSLLPLNLRLLNGMGVAFSSFKERPAIMKHIMPYDLVEMKSRTITSLLIRMMIKSCLLPVSLNFEKNVVRFNFWSRSTMIHLLLFYVPNIAAVFLYWYGCQQGGIFSHFMENTSFAEKFSSFGTCLIFYALYLILPLAKRLNSLQAHLVVRDQLRFPKYGLWNILGFLSMTTGCVLFNTGLVGKHSTEAENCDYYIINPSNFFIAVSQSFMWCIISIVIQVWIENIAKIQCQDVLKDTKIFVRDYRKLTAALQNYFFYSFAIFQVVSITTLFLTCSKLILQVQ